MVTMRQFKTGSGETNRVEGVLLPVVPCGNECRKEHGKVKFLANQSFLNISCSEERQKDPVTTSFFRSSQDFDAFTIRRYQLVLSQVKAFLSSLGPSYIKPKR